jgi:hypothetical protein
MAAYWVEFLKIMLPGLLLMSASAAPLAIGTLAAVFHLRKRNVGPYLRSLWASTGAGFVALGLLSGSLFGTDLSKSSTAGLIFLFVPIYAGIALGIGYGLGALAHRRAVKLAGAVDQDVTIPSGARRFVWVPVAMLGVLMFGIIKHSVQHNDMAVAERASDPDTLHWVYAKMERGEADPFSIPLFLAQNPNAPADLLAKMSEHDHPSVRVFVATNRNTDLTVVASLKNDCSDYVRKAVEERLKLPSGSNSALQPTPKCGAAERKR